MPRINALPSDSAPDPADMVPMIDVDADRTESVTLANLAASTAFVDGAHTLTNKTLSGFTNTIYADDLHFEICNRSGATLTKGTPVYASGYNVGQELVEVSAADASEELTAFCVGVIEADVANNASGGCIGSGVITDVDTSAFSVGDILYVSETAGQLTNVAPSNGAFVQRVGEVLGSNANNGVIAVSLSQTRKTGFAHDVLNAADAATARTTLGVTIGTDVQAFDADLATLAGGTLPSNLTSTIDARYKPPRLAPMARANKISRDESVLRVGLMGMSIASFNTALPYLGARLREEYGAPNYSRGAAGSLSGSWETAHQGWEKQPYGGRNYTRLRGKAASSNLTFEAYCDTVTLWFSTESNSESCNIEIDDVVVGTTPAAGAQQYSVKQTFAVTAGYHKIEVIKPAGAGYVYLEEYEFLDSAVPGVIAHDWTLGGASLGASTALRGPSGVQVTGIAISGNVGIDGYFDNDDMDLYVVMHDVNDAGRGSTEYTNNFLPMFNRMVDLTRARAVPLVLVSSMAGHYALETVNADQYAVYNLIRNLYRSTALTESHVTHVDWHGATILDDIEVYQSTYYTGVTDLDIVAGTYSGDFIHPGQNAYATLHTEWAKVFGFSNPDGSTAPIVESRRRIARANTPLPIVAPVSRDVAIRVAEPNDWSFNQTTDQIETTTPHGLAVGDRLVFAGGGVPQLGGWTGRPMWVLSVPTTTTLTVSYSDGGDQFTDGGSALRAINYAVFHAKSKSFQGPSETALMPNWYAGAGFEQGFTETPVWFDDASRDMSGGAGMAEQRLAIQSAPDGTDEFGNYALWASATNVTVRNQTHFDNDAYILIRYSGTLEVGASTNMYFADTNGDAMDVPVSGFKRLTFPVTEVGSQPLTALVRVRATGSGDFYTVSTGTHRIYDVALSLSPTWPAL